MNISKKIKREKDYKKKRNMLRNNVKQSIVKGRPLLAGNGLIPKNKKYAKSNNDSKK